MLKTIKQRKASLFVPPPIGTVLYLTGVPFGGSTIRDMSPYGNNGTITGATWGTSPGGLWVLSFDGNDYVGCGNNASLQITNNLTVLYWIKTPASFPDTSSKVFVSKFTSAGNQRSWYTSLMSFDDVAVANRLGIAFGDPVSGVTVYEGYYASALSVSTWYCTGFTFASGTVVMYLNGDAVTLTTKSGAIPATLFNSSASVLFGAINAGAASFFTGHIGMGLMGITTVWTAAQMLNWYQQTRYLLGV